MKDSRTYHLKKQYGITPEEYDKLLMAQKGKCYACGRAPKPGKRRLAVDHDHKIGNCREAVRALLCWFCNRVLGRLERYNISGKRLDEVRFERPAQYILNPTPELKSAKS